MKQWLKCLFNLQILQQKKIWGSLWERTGHHCSDVKKWESPASCGGKKNKRFFGFSQYFADLCNKIVLYYQFFSERKMKNCRLYVRPAKFQQKHSPLAQVHDSQAKARYLVGCIYAISILMEFAFWHKNQKVLIVQKNLLFISSKSEHY